MSGTPPTLSAMTITQSADPTVAGSPDVSAHTSDESSRSTEGEPSAAHTGTRPIFTITDAASACSVSRKTITRKLPELASHGAAKDRDGVWRIPVEALLSVGLHPGRSRAEESAASHGGPTQVSVPAPPPPEPGTITIPRDRWDDVRIRLARAEAEAAERALALADARLALRALTAGPAGSPPQPPAAPPATSATPIALGEGTSEPAPGPVGAPAQSDKGSAASAGVPAGAEGGSPAGANAPPAATVGPEPITRAGDPAPAVPSASAYSVVAARQQAARTGGYVPATAPERPKKRRWWQAP